MLVLFVQCMDTVSTQYPDPFIRAAVIESARTSWQFSRRGTCAEHRPTRGLSLPALRLRGALLLWPRLLHPSAAGICQLGLPLLDGS